MDENEENKVVENEEPKVEETTVENNEEVVDEYKVTVEKEVKGEVKEKDNCVYVNILHIVTIILIILSLILIIVEYLLIHTIRNYDTISRWWISTPTINTEDAEIDEDKLDAYLHNVVMENTTNEVVDNSVN